MNRSRSWATAGRQREDRASSASSFAQVFRWLCALVVAAVLSGFAFLLVTGSYIKEGSTVLSLSYNHGIHKGDLLVTAGWFVAMLAVLALATASSRRDSVD